MPNPQELSLTTAMIAEQVGYSTQQVRDLERLGVIPSAQRRPNGYRRYRHPHLVALRAYRALAAAIGSVPARRLMPTLLLSPMDDAAEKIDDLHVTIAQDRSRVREARHGLLAVLNDATNAFDEQDAMAIGELADALGVNTSALRHWEAEGLITPDRITTMKTRRYRARAIAEARIVAVLRAGGYPLPVLSRILTQLRADGLTTDAQRMLDQRLADLTRRSITLLEAASYLHELLSAQIDARLTDYTFSV